MTERAEQGGSRLAARGREDTGAAGNEMSPQEERRSVEHVESAGSRNGATIASLPDFVIPSLDGIRAIAVMIVFVAHAGLGHIVPGGFGVTIFFFLSGYLITSLLRREWDETGRISLRHFYLRRVMRILPPMYLTLVLGLLLNFAGVVPGEPRAPAVLAQAFFGANYYALFGELHNRIVWGTGVLWSLAVEEHFYLLFPLTCLLLFGRVSRRSLGLGFLAACAAVLAWRCVLVLGFHVVENRTYLATDTRIDSILFGCAMGMWCNPVLDAPLARAKASRALLLAASLGILLATFLVRSPVFKETIRYSLQGVALAPIFYLAISESGWLPFRWLQHRVARRLGVYSYATYLSHHTVIYGLNAHLPALHPVLRGVLALAIVLVFAAAMYRFVERPCARLRRRLHHRAAAA